MYTTRCFIAVPLSPPASSVARRLVTQLQQQVPNVKWMRPEEMHITVKFLGELDNRDLLRVGEELRRACAEVEPFSASLEGLGTFPKNKTPRVIWAGVQGGREYFEQLYHQLDQALVELGVPQEGKAYTPHLTLGRVGKGVDMDLLMRSLQRAAPEMKGTFEVDEVVLFTSLREKGGFIHEPIDTVEL
jgi:RNA 2',3'-cyclic 3'-phosphodiesterase